jgi:hypothetical protein
MLSPAPWIQPAARRFDRGRRALLAGVLSAAMIAGSKVAPS